MIGFESFNPTFICIIWTERWRLVTCLILNTLSINILFLHRCMYSLSCVHVHRLNFLLRLPCSNCYLHVFRRFSYHSSFMHYVSLYVDLQFLIQITVDLSSKCHINFLLLFIMYLVYLILFSYSSSFIFQIVFIILYFYQLRLTQPQLGLGYVA